MMNVKFKNDGGFTLPAGALCIGRSYSSALKVTSKPIENVAGVAKGGKGDVDGTITFQLADVPVSLNEPHVSEVVLSPSISM